MPTKEQLQDKINAMSHDMIRMETALVEQRRRSADLFNALSVDCPEAAARLTPESTRGSQFNRLWNMINAVIKDATSDIFQDGPSQDVIDSVQSVLDYYSDHFESRRTLTDEHLAKLAAGRKRGKQNA